MRDRLVELLLTDVECDKDGHGDCSMCEYKYADDECAKYFSERIADFLLENGVIVPPCKVGDIVYLYYPVRKGIYEAVVDEINLTQKSNFIITRDLYFNRRQAVFFEQFGKTVFLTREEAERALKGGAKMDGTPKERGGEK